MTDMEDAILRSLIFSNRIRQKTDVNHQNTIDGFSGKLSFKDYEHLGISPDALEKVGNAGIDLKFVFAHPDLLRTHPEVSQYYRGIAILPQKKVQALACSVREWEEGSLKQNPSKEKCEKVAQLYNKVISAIIEETSDWTLEDGHRNILATMGISLDGTMRNKIGQNAEGLIKTRIREWLNEKGLIEEPTTGTEDKDRSHFALAKGYMMRYSSEPDIEITKNGEMVATIEIKGGKDPAGALERLGAMQKSFEETPPDCQNFLVAGVITKQMESRLKNLGNVKAYTLDQLSHDGKKWEEFVREVFHYAVRIYDE